MNFSPEFALALECCRWNFPSAARPPIDPPKGVDWPHFLRLVRFHRIQGLVWAALGKAGLPASAASALSADARVVAALNLKPAAECWTLADAFAKAGIDLLFVKGLTLSALAYRDPFVKMSSDIDILVEQDAVERSAGILHDLGFRAVVPSASTSAAVAKWHVRNKESAWVNRDNGLVVELLTRLADNARLIPDIGMRSPRQLVPIGGGRVLPTLAIDELLSYLFVHGAGSAWFRLKWIADVAAILAGMDADAVERIYRFARASTAGRAPAQALLLANRLFGLELAPALREELGRDAINRILLKVAVHELLKVDEPTSRLGGTAIFHLTRPLLLEGWRFALGEVSRQVQDVAGRRLPFR